MDAASRLWQSALAHSLPAEEPGRVIDMSSNPLPQDAIALHIKLASLPDQISDPDDVFAPASRGELVKIAEVMERAQEVLQPDIHEDQGRIFFTMKSASSPVSVVSVDITDAFLRFAALGGETP